MIKLLNNEFYKQQNDQVRTFFQKKKRKIIYFLI